MADQIPWQVLVVDDDPEVCRQIEEFLEGETLGESNGQVEVEVSTDFSSALAYLEKQRFDLLILDVRVGPHDGGPEIEDEAGVRVLRDVQQRRFLPIMFYTGLPHLVSQLESPVIRVLDKTSGFPTLLEAINDILLTRLPNVNRALVRYLENIQREYMWNFVVGHWSSFSNATDQTDLAYLLARRLAMSLSGTRIAELAAELGGPAGAGAAQTGSVIHPMRYYILPPVEEHLLIGDILKGTLLDQLGFWVVLTPTCDLVQKKADYVVLAACDLLTGEPEYQKWKGSHPTPSNAATKGLKGLLRNNRDSQSERFVFLPGALTLPDLVVDLQRLVAISSNDLSSKFANGENGLTRLASLDSPFAEALMSRYIRYYGRLGTPDLDINAVLSRLG